MRDDKKSRLMERLDSFASLARRNEKFCTNEEQTKISLVNPYLEVLGYDVRDPRICRLEYTTDIGKQGEKVDYAIMQEDNAAVLIEAKAATQNLNEQKVPPQLQRYFMDSGAKYAVFTNGLEWQWYCSKSSNESHKLADTPFLIHDVRRPTNSEIQWLLTISGPSFSESDAKEQADDARMSSAFHKWIERTRSHPSDSFLKQLIKETQLGTATASRVESARGRFVSTFENFISGETDRLLDAVRDSREENQKKEKERENIVAEGTGFREDFEIDLDDGKPPLVSNKLERAWRISGGIWQREKSSKELQIAVTRYLVSQDIRKNEDFYSTSRGKTGTPNFFQEQYIRDHPTWELNRFSRVEPDLDYWMRTHIGNVQRRKFILDLCKCVQTKDGRKFQIGHELEIWLPILLPKGSSSKD